MDFIADTSFLIGLFVDEPRTQKAREVYFKLKKEKQKVYIPFHAITEVIYVLEKFYNIKRGEVAKYLRSILDTYIFIVEKPDTLDQVLDSYQKLPAINLGDHIIAAEARSKNIKNILTFDPHYQQLGLKVLP